MTGKGAVHNEKKTNSVLCSILVLCAAGFKQNFNKTQNMLHKTSEIAEFQENV
jgi:hypothetical protein